MSFENIIKQSLSLYCKAANVRIVQNHICATCGIFFRSPVHILTVCGHGICTNCVLKLNPSASHVCSCMHLSKEFNLNMETRGVLKDLVEKGLLTYEHVQNLSMIMENRFISLEHYGKCFACNVRCVPGEFTFGTFDLCSCCNLICNVSGVSLFEWCL